MSKREVLICAPVRTAIGTYNGTLKDTPAVELGATAIKACLERAGVAGKDVGTVVMGNVIQAGNKMNPARQAAIGGGIPVEVPAMTVNRVCGSGAQAIATAAAEIQLGLMDTAIAGGMENMDAAPYLMYGARWGYRMGTAQIYDAMLQDGLNDAFSGEHSGWHTEDLASKYQITRDAQDAWALRSQQRFSAAQAAGKFDAEIVPVMVKSRKGPQPFVKDEHNRPETTAESLRQAETGLPKGRHDHGWQCAWSQYGRGGDASRRAQVGREERPEAAGPFGELGRRSCRAGHVRPRSRAGREAGSWSAPVGISVTSSGSKSTRPLQRLRLP